MVVEIYEVSCNKAVSDLVSVPATSEANFTTFYASNWLEIVRVNR